MVQSLKTSAGIVNKVVIGKMSARNLKDKQEGIQDLTQALEDTTIDIEITIIVEINLNHVLVHDPHLLKIIEEEKGTIMIEMIEECREVVVMIEEEIGEIIMIKEVTEEIEEIEETGETEDIMKEIIEVIVKAKAEADTENIEKNHV